MPRPFLRGYFAPSPYFQTCSTAIDVDEVKTRYLRKSDLLLNIVLQEKNILKKLYFHGITELWNHLPLFIRQNASSIGFFKNNVFS